MSPVLVTSTRPLGRGFLRCASAAGGDSATRTPRNRSPMARRCSSLRIFARRLSAAGAAAVAVAPESSTVTFGARPVAGQAIRWNRPASTADRRSRQHGSTASSQPASTWMRFHSSQRVEVHGAAALPDLRPALHAFLQLFEGARRAWPRRAPAGALCIVLLDLTTADFQFRQALLAEAMTLPLCRRYVFVQRLVLGFLSAISSSSGFTSAAGFPAPRRSRWLPMLNSVRSAFALLGFLDTQFSARLRRRRYAGN